MFALGRAQTPFWPCCARWLMTAISCSYWFTICCEGGRGTGSWVGGSPWAEQGWSSCQESWLHAASIRLSGLQAGKPSPAPPGSAPRCCPAQGRRHPCRCASTAAPAAAGAQGGKGAGTAAAVSRRGRRGMVAAAGIEGQACQRIRAGSPVPRCSVWQARHPLQRHRSGLTTAPFSLPSEVVDSSWSRRGLVLQQ